MYALTLHQPWAALVAAGSKRYETRSWLTPEKAVGQLLAIHAGQRAMREAVESPLFKRHTAGREAVRGAVMAVCRLNACIPTAELNPDWPEIHFGDFTPGRFAWELTELIELPAPVPCRGFQRLWHLPQDVETAVREMAGR